MTNQLLAWIHGDPASDRIPWVFLSPFFVWLFHEGEGPPVEESLPQWSWPLVIELAKAWDWYHRNVNRRIYDSLETWKGIDENSRKIVQFYMAQLWFLYDRAVNQPIYESAATWKGNVENARKIVIYGLAQLWSKDGNIQGPGVDSEGPIQEYMAQMSAVDSEGNLISPVGKDVATLMEAHGVTIAFLDLNAGLVPMRGFVVLPPSFAHGGQTNAPGNVGLVAHELAHILERELNDPTYWPDGSAPHAAGFPYLLGDSTNYMEVVSNVVGQTVEYDLIAQIPPLSRIEREVRRLKEIEDNLATFTDSDALNAVRYLVRGSPDVEVYRANYMNEMRISDHRIPAGRWDYWLERMGFSDQAIQHIGDIASKGTVVRVNPGEIDPKTGDLATHAPTVAPVPTPTQTPTPTLSPGTPSPTKPETSTETPIQRQTSPDGSATTASPTDAPPKPGGP